MLMFEMTSCRDRRVVSRCDVSVKRFGGHLASLLGVAFCATTMESSLASPVSLDRAQVYILDAPRFDSSAHAIRMAPTGSPVAGYAKGSPMDCQASTLPPDNLLSAVLTSATVEVFAVKPRDPMGPNRTLRNSDLAPLRSLSGEDLAHLKAIVAESQLARSRPRIVGSCPFIPAIGFRFGGDNGVWWLVSQDQSCQGAVLLGADADWRKTGTGPLSPGAAQEIARFHAQ